MFGARRWGIKHVVRTDGPDGRTDGRTHHQRPMMLTGQSRMKKRASWIRERRAVMVNAASFHPPLPPPHNKVQSSDESSRRRFRVFANCIGRLGAVFTLQRNQREVPRQIPSTGAQRVPHPEPRRRSGASYWCAKDARRGTQGSGGSWRAVLLPELRLNTARHRRGAPLRRRSASHASGDGALVNRERARGFPSPLASPPGDSGSRGRRETLGTR